VTAEVDGKPSALTYVEAAGMGLHPPAGDTIPVVVKIGDRTSQSGVTMRLR